MEALKAVVWMEQVIVVTNMSTLRELWQQALHTITIIPFDFVIQSISEVSNCQNTTNLNGAVGYLWNKTLDKLSRIDLHS